MSAASSRPEVVLVAGGSGFIGRHVIRLLQEQRGLPTGSLTFIRSLAEIRVLDLVPWINLLKHAETVPVNQYTGSILDEALVREAMQGVTTVIHAATYRDLRVWQDADRCESVNVDGTHVLIESAINAGVQKFVYLSSVDVVCGYDPIYYGAENTAPDTKQLILGKYAASQREAERQVCKANGRTLDDGESKMHTAILRPTITYGEGDLKFITEALEVASALGGDLLRVSNIFTRIQPTYVGNVAWAVIKAVEQLKHDSSVGGEAMFITDDTPLLDPFDFLEPFLAERGFGLSKGTVPYWLLYGAMSLIISIVSLVSYLNPLAFKREDWPRELNLRTIGYLVHTFFFNRDKATLRIDYAPLYSWEEAKQRSMAYYRTVPLEVARPSWAFLQAWPLRYFFTKSGPKQA